MSSAAAALAAASYTYILSALQEKWTLLRMQLLLGAMLVYT